MIIIYILILPYLFFKQLIHLNIFIKYYILFIHTIKLNQ
jgi:hypothetical protein